MQQTNSSSLIAIEFRDKVITKSMLVFTHINWDCNMIILHTCKGQWHIFLQSHVGPALNKA